MKTWGLFRGVGYGQDKHQFLAMHDYLNRNQLLICRAQLSMVILKYFNLSLSNTIIYINTQNHFYKQEWYRTQYIFAKPSEPQPLISINFLATAKEKNPNKPNQPRLYLLLLSLFQGFILL